MTSPEETAGGGSQETAAPRPGDQPTGSAQGFGEEAAEMANETEVETPPTAQDPQAPSDTTSASDMVEEGAPLEPHDIDEVEAAPGIEQQLAERTADLQRLQAEYVNYKRRVDRDRELVKQNATYAVLTGLLPVLDDIDRAREHGELEGGFKAVAESLERTVTRLGLERFGAKGDEFDPNQHEALMHGQSAEVTTTVVDVVAQAGYRMGERVVRAAKVTVIGPE